MSEVQIQQTPWNVFDKIIYKDDSTTKYEYAEYPERNITVTNRDDYFLITQDLDLPLLLSDSFIHVTCNITNSTGGNIQQGKVALCHNGFNLFQRAQYLLNEQIIEDVDELGIATTVKGFIDYSRSFSKTLDTGNVSFELKYLRLSLPP